jgi:outer membrane protein assembly factor BamB
MGILLPLGPLIADQAGQSVPAAASPPASTPAAPVAPAAPEPAPAAKAAPAYRLEWKHALDSGDLSTKVVVTPTVVVTAGVASVMRAHARTSGEEIWTSDHTAWRTLTSGDQIIFGATSQAIEARDETSGAVRWTIPVAVPPARLAAERGWLIVADGGVLTAYRAADGSVVWRLELGTPITTTPSVGAASVVVGLSNQQMAAIDLKAGTLVWTTPVSGVAEHVSLSDDRLFAALSGGILCALDLDRGATRWCYDFHIPLVGAPLIEGRTIAIALYDNTIRRLDAGNGAVRRQDKIGARPATAPIATPLGTLVPLTDAQLGMFAADFKPLPRVPTANPLVTQSLEDVSVLADASAVATIAVAPGGIQTLALYTRVVPAPATPAATVPAKTDDTASDRPPGPPATSPGTAAPAPATAPPATAP